jgi:hypothetical protein
MSYAHLRSSDDGQITVIREIFAGYALTHGLHGALTLTRDALLTLGWDSAESAEGARLADSAERNFQAQATRPVKLGTEHRDKL